MSRDASVVRDTAGLNRLSDTLSEAPVRAIAGRRDFEDVALAMAARAVTAAALARDESRGCHHRAEYPGPAPEQAQQRAAAGRRPQLGGGGGAGGGGMLMLPDERSAAQDTIRRALEEDLRYGPDVTTLATVPAGTVATASMVPREAGVIAGVEVALLVLDAVLAGATTWCTASRTAPGCSPASRC